MNSAGNNKTWFRACMINDVPENGGVCVKYQSHQIALFYFTRRSEWFATQNMCPHRQQMSLSRGMLGSHGEEPKIACPFHKKTFSLTDGRCMNSDEGYRISTYDVRIEEGAVYIDVTSLDDDIINHTNNNAYAKINH
ncbi:MAG: nitrite reductase small subunit NirD [Chitinophagaceae bacterium]|nr:nitrite reductase small subunit NirD [Chitinophagaceae bacterium]